MDTFVMKAATLFTTGILAGQAAAYDILAKGSDRGGQPIIERAGLADQLPIRYLTLKKIAYSCSAPSSIADISTVVITSTQVQTVYAPGTTAIVTISSSIDIGPQSTVSGPEVDSQSSSSSMAPTTSESSSATSTGSTSPTPLIDAGDFESGSWGNWGYLGGVGGSFRVESPGRTGNYGGVINVAASTSGNYYLQYPSYLLNLQEGVQYRFSADVKFDTDKCGLRFWATSNNGKAAFVNVDANSGQDIDFWMNLKGTFLAAQDMNLLILVDCAGVANGIIHFDNIVLAPISSIVYNLGVPAAVGNNLVRDGDLESGTTNNFEITSYSSVSYNLQNNGFGDESYGLSVSLYEQSNGRQAYAIIAQTLPDVVKDSVYRVTFSMKYRPALTSACFVQASLSQGTLWSSGWSLMTGTPYQPDSWYPMVGGAMVAQTDGAQLMLQMQCNGPSPGMMFWFDNLSVVQLSQ